MNINDEIGGAWWKYTLDSKVKLHYFMDDSNISICRGNYKDQYWILPDSDDISWKTIMPCSKCLKKLSKNPHDWDNSNYHLNLLSLYQRNKNEENLKLLKEFNREHGGE